MGFKTQKTLNFFLSALMVILAFPTTAILASWNSMPGSGLYPVKRGLERIALKLLPASVLEIEFRNKLIDRRFSEANSALIQESSTRGLPEIVAEAKSAQIALTKLSPQEKTQATQKLVRQLNSTSQKLETVKTTVTVAPSAAPATQVPTTQVPSPLPTPPTPAPANPASEITQTQEELKIVIDNIENNLTPTEPVSEDSDQPKSEDKENRGRGHKDKDKD